MQQAENSTEPSLASTAGHFRTGSIAGSAIADLTSLPETTAARTADLPLPEQQASDQLADSSAYATPAAHQGSNDGASLADGSLGSLDTTPTAVPLSIDSGDHPDSAPLLANADSFWFNA